MFESLQPLNPSASKAEHVWFTIILLKGLMLQFNLCYSLKTFLFQLSSFCTKVICAFLLQIKLEETIGHANLSILSITTTVHLKGLLFFHRDHNYASLPMRMQKKTFFCMQKPWKGPCLAFYSNEIIKHFGRWQNVFRFDTVKEEINKLNKSEIWNNLAK